MEKKTWEVEIMKLIMLGKRHFYPVTLLTELVSNTDKCILHYKDILSKNKDANSPDSYNCYVYHWAKHNKTREHKSGSRALIFSITMKITINFLL